jgi:hypothetical protein
VSDAAPAFEEELALPPELRQELGLRDGEHLRVLRRGTRTLQLERTGGSGATALPWDRDLVLSADVRAFPIADVLGLIHRATKSGFLLFCHGEHEKAVYLHRGEVVFAASNRSVDRIGECLLRAGVISLEQLREAERSYDPSERFGKILVCKGYLSARELWNGVKYQVEETVRSLFAYTAGDVHFWEGEVQPDNVVRLSLPTKRLVAEGLQRRDELLKLLASLEDPRVEVRACAGAGSHLAGNERTFFETLSETGYFPTLCRRAGLDPLSGARTVQLLRLVGAVQVVRTRTEPGFVGEADLLHHDEDGVRGCVANHVKLLGELAAPIVAVDGPDDVRLRLLRVLEDAAERHPQLLRGLEVGAHATLDPDELIGRALRLPGERERAVATALGELVTYLEFELKNHPRIPDPDVFLEALEPLRTQIEA